jgi:catechol 2,3-dioxygenase-like lactoylglutathione lyase family enzyme
MLKLEHLEIAVHDTVKSRDFYVNRLGFKIEFEVAPSRLCWGYGAERREPSDYLLRLWDEISLRKHSTVAR